MLRMVTFFPRAKKNDVKTKISSRPCSYSFAVPVGDSVTSDCRGAIAAAEGVRERSPDVLLDDGMCHERLRRYLQR